jgi:cold shock CspA family protein
MKGIISALKVGFGFVRGEDGNDYFFHQAEMLEKGEFAFLGTGTKVKFNTEESKKGLRAVLLEIDDESS